MNFLAHLYLSGNSKSLRLGNFIADSVKGSAWLQYPKPIKRGIMLHRAIDDFTDSHPTVSKSKEIFREKYRHYAGVIVDIVYDHYLAKNWSDYSSIPLATYAQNVYREMEEQLDFMPEKAQYMLPFMIRHNWLEAYAQLSGIQQVLRGMANRTRFDSHMDEATQELKANYDSLQSDFEEFFPQLQQHTRLWLEQNP